MYIRKDDQVEVIAGDDKGTVSDRRIAKVLRVLPERNKIVVEGVNRVYKHMRPSQKNPQGGRLSKEMPIDVSNVMLIDPQTNKPTRVGVRYLADGSKELYAKKSGAALRKLSKPRPAYASQS
jgi:large subunit ribosomal protein L24